MNHDTRSRLRQALALVLLAAAGWGCGGGGGEATTPARSDKLHHGNGVDDDQAAIVLKDASGAPITAANLVAYSPQQTCGTCHDFEKITKGYHFAQGRVAMMAKADPADTSCVDAFNPSKPWLLSDGMYGKW